MYLGHNCFLRNLVATVALLLEQLKAILLELLNVVIFLTPYSYATEALKTLHLSSFYPICLPFIPQIRMGVKNVFKVPICKLCSFMFISVNLGSLNSLFLGGLILSFTPPQ